MSVSPIELAERGVVPDPLISTGIQQLLRERLREARRGDPDSLQRLLTSQLSHGPIAEHAADANSQHYEVPTAFYAHVLGPRKKYSSAVFPTGQETLQQAEELMLGLTCQRAGIEDGMEILELGCGWGSLTLWMAQYFPHSRITAMSNSSTQRAWIEARLAERGWSDRVRILTHDINTFDPAAYGVGQVDRVVSVEMFEHLRNWRELFRRVASWLGPEGRLFAHVFANRRYAYLFEDRGDKDWMARHFFTGGLMPSRDLFARFDENLVLERSWWLPGTHYELTSRAWLANLDDRAGRLMPILRETYGAAEADRWRMRWRLFFLACAELFGFDEGREWGVVHARLRKREG